MSEAMKPDAGDLHDEFPLPPPDRLQAHYRRQLSAMLDGELTTDEGRFMRRRLEHDAALAGCLARWQLCGEVLRVQRHALLPEDFAGRVAAAVRAQAAADAVPAPRAPAARPARWGGRLAMAASVAVMALLVGRQLPMGGGADAGASPGGTANGVPLALAESPAPGTAATAGRPAADDAAAASLATAVAATAIPAQRATRSRGQGQRAAMRARAARAAEASAPPVLLAASSGATRASDELFPSQPVAPARPWPRAVLPALGGGGTFSAGYADTGAESPFRGFEPRLQLPPVDAAAGEPAATPASGEDG